MPIQQRTRQQLIDDLTQAIVARDRAVETGYGPAKDLVIDPVSLVVRDSYTQLQKVYDIQFLVNAAAMDPEDLDLYGESFGIKRKGPRRSVGSAFFFTASRPAADLTIPAGLPITTSSVGGVKSVQSYITTRTSTLFATSADAYFNPSAGVFEIEVPIRSVVAGADGDVAPATITNMQRQIPGFSGVTNKSSTVGGRDAETNDEYARRIRLALLGSGRGTRGGLERFILEDTRVVDALVVMSGDPLMVRDEEVAGAVDVYLLGEEPTVITQTETYDGLDIVIDNEPLIFPGAITEVSTASTGALTEGVHFFVVRDVILDGSAEARNIIRWNRAASGLPTTGEAVTIEYVYDKLVADLQQSIEAPDNDLLADVLVRRATAVDVVVEATVRISPVSSQSDLEADIRSAIKSFINTRGLGESIVASDLDIAIRAVPGVDFVVLPFDRLSTLDVVASDTVPVAKNEYARSDDINITVNLSV